MAKRPLTLNWKDLLPGRKAGDPPPLEAADVQASELSDYDLQEKIKRYTKSITDGVAGKLPDKGVRIHAIFRQLSEESDRRSMARIQKGVEVCPSALQTKSEKLPDRLSESGSNVSRAEPNSGGNINHETDFAFSEELRVMSQGKNRSSGEKGLQVQDEAGISSRQLPSVCCTKRDKQSLINNKFLDTGASKICSSHTGKPLTRRASKRRRTSKRRSLSLDFEEVQHVVLLDDEDVLPIRSRQGGDASDDWKEYKVYYPSRDDPECVELSQLDLKCLDPESYLSSPIMNYYVQFLQRSDSFLAARRGDCYIFNTFFYSKLEEAMTCKDNKATSFEKLRRWWKGVDIFQKAYILLPIHGGLHWSLVIICIPAKEDESTLILHLDSLGVHASNQIFSVVGRYLKQEWNYINHTALYPDLPISERVWRFPCRIDKEKVEVPQQKNDYDCGLFVLYFMKKFIKQAPERLGKNNLSMFSRKWFDPAKASALRNTIRELIMREFKKIMLKGETESQTSSNTSEST